MPTNFPTSKDDGTSLPSPTAANPRNAPSLAGGQDNQNDAIIAIEAKVGTGSSTPANNTFFIGNGVGTSTWGKVVPAGTIVGTSDSQTLTNKTLTSPTINTATISNPTLTVDTVTGFSTSNTGTVFGVSVTTGVIASAALANSVNTAALQSAAVTSAKVATGFVVQVVHTGFSAVATGTTVIPFDDTIPQITEGDQYMAQAITPKSTTNRLFIDVLFFGSISIGNDLVVALFQDSTANALTATSNYNVTATGRDTIRLGYEMAAGTTSSTTFSVRAGPAGAATTTFNGDAGARLYGAINKSFIRITEVTA